MTLNSEIQDGFFMLTLNQMAFVAFYSNISVIHPDIFGYLRKPCESPRSLCGLRL